MVAPKANPALVERSNADLDARMPRKRCSAAVLLFDSAGRVLLVKPTYRESWLLPGGMVEAGETPADAALRELSEECCMTAQLRGLVCTDIVPPTGGFSESVHFLFLASATDEQCAAACANDNEISTLEWVEPAEALRRLPPSAAARFDAVTHGHRGYFEHGAPRLAFLDPAWTPSRPDGSTT